VSRLSPASRRVRISRFLCILLASAAGPAAAQENIGAFTYQRQADPVSREDRSWAATRSAEGEGGATLRWSCFDRYLELTAGFEGMDAAPVRMAWRFAPDADAEPRAAGHRADADRLAVVPYRDHHPLTRGVLQADSLFLRTVDADGAARDWRFSLEGAGVALLGLKCVRTLQPDGSHAEPDEFGRLWLANAADAMRAADSVYPPDLRREGRRGVAVATVQIAEDGRVRGAAIESLDEPRFEEAVRRVAASLRFVQPVPLPAARVRVVFDSVAGCMVELAP